MLKKLQNTAKKAYVPYSKFHVSAIFVLKDGSTYDGFNIENAAYPSSMCAERVAIYSMINHGVDTTQVEEIHVFTPDSQDFLSPCGACRQVLTEFINPETKIFMYNKEGKFIQNSFIEIAPLPVKRKTIQGE